MTAPELYRGPIVDAHHHLWTYATDRHPWLGEAGLDPLRRSFTPADYAAAVAGLDVVQTVWIEALAADPLAEARTAQRWNDADPRICNAIVAHVGLDAPDAGARLDALQRHVPNLRGVRDIVAARPGVASLARRPDLLADPAFAAGLGVLAERDLSFDLMLEPHQLPGAARLLGRMPDLRVAIEHAGSPDLGDPAGRRAWEAGLRDMAALPHVAIKVSALHCRMPNWTDAALAEPILAIIGLFGPDRVAFASDYPAHDRTCSLKRSFETFRAAVGHMPPESQRALFCDTARRVYRIERAGRSG